MTVNRIQPNLELIDLLQDAYAPCKNFGVCPEACWQPANGHIPRGFLGATGDLSEVELIMLFAQPGAPHDEERYDPGAHSTDLLLASVEHAYKCFSTSKYSFHRNAIWFLKQLYPDLSFDEQLRRALSPTRTLRMESAPSAISNGSWTCCQTQRRWHSAAKHSTTCRR